MDLSDERAKCLLVELPVASVTRVVKAALPESTQIGKEAKAALSRAAGIFVLYLTSA